MDEAWKGTWSRKGDRVVSGEHVPPVGAAAPGFALVDPNGDEVSLAKFLAQGHVVLYFLRAFS